jgi:hypothetical protein
LRQWVRSNVLGLVAIFIALSGSAVATMDDGGSRDATKAAKKKAAKKKRGKRGPPGRAGPQGPQGLQGAEGPQGDQGSEGDQGPQGPSALRLDYDQPRGTGVATIGTQDELTISASCGPLIGATTLALQVASSVAAEISYFTSEDSGGAPVLDNQNFQLTAGAPIVLFNDDAMGAGFVRQELSVVYRNANRVITLQLHTVVDNAAERCKVQGTAVPAS